jgi:hypothetical protein
MVSADFVAQDVPDIALASALNMPVSSTQPATLGPVGSGTNARPHPAFELPAPFSQPEAGLVLADHHPSPKVRFQGKFLLFTALVAVLLVGSSLGVWYAVVQARQITAHHTGRQTTIAHRTITVTIVPGVSPSVGITPSLTPTATATSSPTPGSQPTATPTSLYPHVPFAVNGLYGGANGTIIFYNRSVHIDGTVNSNKANDCARVDFYTYAGNGTLLLSSAQSPTDSQVPGGYTCNSFSFSFTLSANVAGGASYVEVDLYFSQDGLVASHNYYR